MKPIRLSNHAQEQCLERGATETEVRIAVCNGMREQVKHGRSMCRYNFPFEEFWEGKHYTIKQVAPIIVEEEAEIVVITVFTFYF